MIIYQPASFMISSREDITNATTFYSFLNNPSNTIPFMKENALMISPEVFLFPGWYRTIKATDHFTRILFSVL